jgi:hypothetical protein
MASFDNLTHKQKALKCAQQHFKTQISLQIQINLDPTVR